MPAPLSYPEYGVKRNAFLKQHTPLFLIGAVHQRLEKPGDKDYSVFNSAFLIDVNGEDNKTFFDPADHIVDYYDKVHRVPFGEFTPLASIFPWLRELIGMGRDLTPGRKFHVLSLPNNAQAGVNICF